MSLAGVSLSRLWGFMFAEPKHLLHYQSSHQNVRPAIRTFQVVVHDFSLYLHSITTQHRANRLTCNNIRSPDAANHSLCLAHSRSAHLADAVAELDSEGSDRPSAGRREEDLWARTHWER